MSTRIRRQTSTLCTILFLLVAGAAIAQFGGPGALYDGGRLSFSYAQMPFPFYRGSFAAEGPALPADGNLPPGAEAAVGGVTAPTSPDSVTTVIYAVRANPAGTYDGSVIAVRTLGTLVPGNYPVDLTTGSAMFLFVDEAQQFSLPDTLTEDGIRQWLQDLAAEHILASVSGSIQVAEASSDTLHGTFSGLTADSSNPLLLVNVSSGRFALSGLDDPVSAVDLPRRGTPSLAVAPNPFNPLTTAAFRLPTTQRIDAAVYDLTGRLVRVLHAGELPAGEHRLTWHGCDRADRRAPAGVYLMRVRGPGWQECAKVALVP